MDSNTLLLVFWTTLHDSSSIHTNYFTDKHVHKFSIKFRSRDWLGHINRLFFFVLSCFFKLLFDCLGSMLSISVHLQHPITLHFQNFDWYNFDWYKVVLVPYILVHDSILLSIDVMRSCIPVEKQRPVPLHCCLYVLQSEWCPLPWIVCSSSFKLNVKWSQVTILDSPEKRI